MNRKNCAHCGTEFETKNRNKKYCKPGCSTMACNKRRGFKVGRVPIEGKDKNLSAVTSSRSAPQGMNGVDLGRAKDEVTLAGALESFLGASTSNFFSHQLTKGKYDERIAKLQRDQTYLIELLERLAGVQNPKKQENKGMPILKTNQPMAGMQKIDFPDQPLM